MQALAIYAAREDAAPEPRGPASSGAPEERPATSVADRVAADPLTLNDAWANAIGRPATGGMHDSVISHNPQEPIVKLINEKNIKI